jgi:hypothetical protein
VLAVAGAGSGTGRGRRWGSSRDVRTQQQANTACSRFKWSERGENHVVPLGLLLETKRNVKHVGELRWVPFVYFSAVGFRFFWLVIHRWALSSLEEERYIYFVNTWPTLYSLIKCIEVYILQLSLSLEPANILFLILSSNLA